MDLRRSTLLAWLLACQCALGASAPGHDHRPPPAIAWFAGDVADAFTAARAAHKPVFLYWGAAWCPPCQELKATVFRRQDFLDRLTLFVPVYLDGDLAGAQAWGERFHISGYPTVLVLRSDETELERVSGGMDLSRYSEMLDLALGQGRPARDLLASLGTSDTAPSEQDCRRLAYNAWRLDDAWSLHPESLDAVAAALDSAAARCPATLRVERARLLVTAADAALHAEQKDLQAAKRASPGLEKLLDGVAAVLAERPLALAVGDALRVLPAEFFTASLRLEPARHERLRERWFALMDALSTDRRYSAADQLDALGSKLIAARALDPAGKIPAPLAKAVAHRIDESLAREHDPYARASLINSALNVLQTLGDEERAYAILAGEIKTSAYPYYYMSDLAELEEKRGHSDVAIEWLARSFRTAQGPATRFQWGVGYVRALVRMRPQDDAAIRDAAVAVLAELEAAGDLHGRTRRSLGRLEASLRDWNRDASHPAAIAAVRERMRAICGRFPVGDAARPACEDFLARS